MKVGRAKVLTTDQFDEVLSYVHKTSSASLRDVAMLAMSFKAGLRAKEIALLSWSDVTDAAGNVGRESIDPVSGGITVVFEVPARAAKGGHSRTVPMHPFLRTSLVNLRTSRPRDIFIIHPLRPTKLVHSTPNAIAQYLRTVLIKTGLEGASSHSGRRTFITNMARQANLHHCSLRDVQLVAGHRRIQTTEAYIEPSEDVASLISSA